MASPFTWLGDRAKQIIGRRIDAKMREAGKVAVFVARQHAPVRTGHLRDSIGYTYIQSQKVLNLYADASYAVFIEFGTRYMGPHPFLRPGLAAAAKVWGGTGQLGFANVPPTRTPLKVHHMTRHLANQKINEEYEARAFGRGKGPTSVFHGDHPGSLLGFKPTFKHTRKF